MKLLPQTSGQRREAKECHPKTMVHRTTGHKILFEADVYLMYEHGRNYVLFKDQHKDNIIRVQAVKVYGGVELNLGSFTT